MTNKFTVQELEAMAYLFGEFELWSASPDDDVLKKITNAIDAMANAMTFLRSFGLTKMENAIAVIRKCDWTDEVGESIERKIERLTEGDLRELIVAIDGNKTV